MRHLYIVSYDISDPGRLRRVHGAMRGFGDPLHYSVFCCSLSGKEKVLMVAALAELIHHGEDRVMIVDLGPTEGRAEERIEFLGRSTPFSERRAVVV